MKYYCIGIKGSGMATLACLLSDLGHTVSGYDDAQDFKYTEVGLTKITAVSRVPALNYQQFHNEDSNVDFWGSSILGTLGKWLNLTSDITPLVAEGLWYPSYAIFDYYASTVCSEFDDPSNIYNNNISMKTCKKRDTGGSPIGFPRVGEMFTSQIDKDKSYDFWTLTSDGGRYVNIIDSSGGKNLLVTGNSNIRPSFYLKSNVVISKDNTGDGTYEHPYDIELGA